MTFRLAAAATALVVALAGCTTTTAGGSADDDPKPNPNAKVTPIDFEGAAPPDAEVQGTFQAAIGWKDRYGRNAVVIGIKTTEAGDTKNALLVADHLLWEGSSWNLQRRFKQLVDQCQFDVELEAFTGKWSLTDLDNNGLGEATFAWRSGCRSDVSPVEHKVLLVTMVDTKTAKFVLRGQTAVDDGSGQVLGGKYKADPAFEGAPKGFLKHAEKVWGLTSSEKMN